MKVRDIMTREVRTCTPATNLAEAGALLLDGDCGILPVVADGRLAGVVTDRDICIAVATRNRRASELTVGEVIQAPAFTVSPDDDVHAALAEMRVRRVRRLPVVGFGGTVAGIVSLDDLVRVAGPHEAVQVSEVADVLRAISAHHLPVAHVTAT